MAIITTNSAGTDWSRYTVKSKDSTKTLASNNVYETILSVSGEGYIAKCHFTTSGTADVTLRITMDGVEVFRGMVANTNQTSGWVRESDMVYNIGTGGASLRIPNGTAAAYMGTISEYPAVADSNVMVFLPQPVFFKSSLLIETKTSDTTKNCVYSYQGGVV
jgi:hypothetical protein